MAAKCNIISSVLEKLLQIQWGVKRKNVDDIILENYIEQLDCECVQIEICNEADCINTPIVVVCSLSIAKISNIIADNKVTFFLADGDLTNGLAPYSYNWSYEVDDFDTSGAINLKEATLTVKPNKSATLLVTKIVVSVTDANGCKAIKTCYLTQQGMQCSANFVPCPPPTNFSVKNKNTVCPSPKSLLVFKKI